MSSRLDAGLEEIARTQSAKDTTGWAALVERVINELHPEQREFALDTAKRVVGLVGRGGGKTTGGRARLVKKLLTVPRCRCLYIATTRDHAKRLMWDPLKELFSELGFVTGVDVVYNETELRLRLPKTGAELRLHGADKEHDVEKLRGITYHEIGIDEGASYSGELLKRLIERIVGPRMGKDSSIWIIGTPGHILNGYFYDLTRPGSEKSRPWKRREEFPGWRGWSYHDWTLASAIEATQDRPIEALEDLWAEALERKAVEGWSDSHPIWLREYLGRWAADDTVMVYRYRIHDEHGALWNQWDPKRVGALGMAELPTTFKEWVHIIGMDLGHTDPTAINVFAFAPADSTRTIYHRYGFEQTKMYAQLVAHKLIGADMNHARPGGVIGAIGSWPNGFVADSAHQMGAAMLDELHNVYGLKIEPATKGFSYKLGAIEIVNGDLIDGRIKVLKGSLLESQLLELQWGVGRNGDFQERADQPNHSCDSLIYARQIVGTLLSAGVVGGDDVEGLEEGVPPPERGDDDYSDLFQDDYSYLD